MKSTETIKRGAIHKTAMGPAHRAILPAMWAIATIGLVLTSSPAPAAQEHTFKAVVNSFTYSYYHGGYNVFDLTGTGTVVGDFSAEVAIHFRHGSTSGEGWWTITAANGDLLDLVFKQTGSFETGYWAGPYTIVGGTGRFVNATGSGTFVTVSDAAGYPVSASLEGTISF